MPAGFAGLGKAVEADRERERKRRLAAARAERERRRKEAAEAAAARARMQDAHDRAAQVTAATKRTERSREIVAEAKRSFTPRLPETRAEAARRGSAPFPRLRNPLGGRLDRTNPKTIAELTREQEASGLSDALGDNLLGRGVRDLEMFATNLPLALYGMGRAVAGDLKNAATASPRDIVSGDYFRKQSPTWELLKGMGSQIKEDYRHPIRYASEHPGFFLLDALALVSAGAGTGARIGATGRAAQKGGIRAALTRPTAEGGSLLRRPPPGVRKHVFEGQVIEGRYSQDAFARAVQKLHDRRTGGKISARKAGRLESERRRIVDAAEKAEALAALGRYKKLSTPKQLAIRVVAEGLPLDDVIEAHLRMAANAKGKIRKQHARMARLLETARPYLTVNSKGKPVFSAGNQHLARAMRELERVVRKREKGLLEAGLLTPEQVTFRRHAPGRVLLGAEWEPVSIAEAGVKQPFQLIGRRVRTRDGIRGSIIEVRGDTAVVRPWSKKVGGPFEASLDDLFPASKTAKGKLVGGGRAVQYERPRTIAEADARIAELEAYLEPRFERMVKELGKMSPAFHPRRIYGGAGLRGGTKRVIDDFRIGGGQTGRFVEDPRPMLFASPRKTGAQRAREYVEKRIDEIGARPDAPAFVKEFREKMYELSDLREAVNQAKAPWLVEPGETVRSLGTVTETKALGAFEGGRFRVPEATLDKPWLMHRPQQYRGGFPRKPGTLTHPYTGALRRQGKTTIKTVEAIVQDALQSERFFSVDHFRQRILRYGHLKKPPGNNWAAVYERKLRSQEAKALRDALREVEVPKLTPDEAARLEAQIRMYVKSIIDEDLAKTTAAGVEIPGVRWVDKRLLDSQRKIITGRVPLYFDEAADATKGLMLYLKPAYVAPNVIGNALFNLFQQGFLAPTNWIRATRMKPHLAPLVDEIMGQGFSAALAAGTQSRISAGVQKVGNAWSVFVDRPFRRASFLHEARKAGFKTDKQIEALIRHPRNRAKLVEVSQRARDAIIDYERLTPVEQDIIRRGIFVYPWVRGSAHYAVQFLRDHPIQAAVYARIGREAEGRWGLPGLPSWMEGSFRVGGSDDMPIVVNPRFVNPLETLAEGLGVAQGMAGLKQAGRTERIGQSVHPLIKATIETIFGRDMFTGQDIQPRATTFPERLGRMLPQYQTYKRYSEMGTPEQKRAARPVNTWYDVLAPYVIGSAAPRATNLAVVQRQAEDERKRFLTAEQRLREKHKTERETVFPALKGKVDKEDLAYIRRAYSISEQMDVIRLKAQKEAGEGEPYYRAVLEAEARYMGKLGVFDREDVRYLVGIARNGSYEEVRSKRAQLVSTAYEAAYLKARRFAREQAGWTGG
jgi:hypothetical protein